MVKGVTRQVVVVKAPDNALFDQAVFLLRDHALEKHGIGEQELLEEARRLADRYVTPPAASRHRVWPPLVWIVIGAACVACPWLLTVLL